MTFAVPPGYDIELPLAAVHRWRGLGAKVLSACFLLVLLIAPAAATPAKQAERRASEVGLPAVQIFAPGDYDGDAQNWAVVQDSRGLIYVGNGDGAVMEFDGVRWRRIALPNQVTVRSVAVGADGLIYVGAQGELGYLAPNRVGEMTYVSLMPKLKPDERRFADVWKTYVVNDDIYFFTTHLIIRVRGGQVRTWKSDKPLHMAFVVHGRLFAREFDKGLLELVGDEFRPVPGGERFAQEKIYVMLPWHAPKGATAGHILIGTRTQGLMVFDGVNAYRPWKTQTDGTLPSDVLYAAQRLANDGVALATLQGGLIVLDREGRQTWRLDRKAGLGDDTVFAVEEDREQGLWVALNAGVTRVASQGALSRFDSRNGLVGSAYPVQRHAGHLYVGTSSGLFRLETRAGGGAQFIQVPGVSGLVWSGLDLGDALLFGTITGVFELRDGVIRSIPGTESAISLTRSALEPSRVFIGTANGIQAIRRTGDREWVKESLSLHTGTGIYTLLEDDRGRVWLGTHGESIHRLNFPGLAPGQALPEPQMESFGSAAGLPSGVTMVHSVGGAPAFATSRGIMRFDDGTSRFIPAPEFSSLFPDGVRRIGPLHEDAKGRLWMYSQNVAAGVKELGVATRGADGQYRWDSSALRAIAGVSYLSLYVEDDGVAWFGSESALHRYDPNIAAPPSPPFKALVRKVSGRNERVLYGGAGALPLLELPSTERSLRFEYAAPSYDTMKANRYQVMLEGVDPDWSPWSPEGYRDYTTLPTGRHRFRVRAQNVHGTIGEEAVFEFHLLPPWYLTWWAYLAYGVMIVAVLWAAFRWRSAALMRRNLELASLVDRRTGELSQANRALLEQSVTDPLTGLKNRRYVLDHIEGDIALVDRAYADGQAGQRPVNADLLFLLVDIDHFKEVNDRYGHAAGDRVLEQFRSLLLSAARKVDTPIRWGGEEFLVIARNVDLHAGKHLAERIRSVVANHEFDLGNGETLYRTCSVGFASYPFFVGAPQRLGWEQVVDIADQCLYMAKHGGRNTWIGAHSVIGQPPSDLEERLHSGIQSLVDEGAVRLEVFGEGT